jgi:DNA-binding beta-propeller fold protein YncE
VKPGVNARRVKHLRTAHWSPLRVCASARCFALAVLLTGAVSSAAVAQSPAGTLVVLNKSDDSALLLDLPGGRLAATLPTGPGPHEVAVSPDGRWAVVSNYGDGRAPGHTLTLLDLSRGVVARTVELAPHHRPHGLAWSPDGRWVLVTVEADRAVLLVDAEVWAVRHAIPTGQETSHMVAVAPDGRRAYVGNIGGGSVSMLDVRRGRLLRVAQTGAGTEGVAVAPDGGQVWAVNRAADAISVLDPRTLATLATLPCPDFPIRVRFTPDGRLALVTTARSSELHLFDVATRRSLGTVVFSLDSSRAAPTLLGTQFARSAVPVGVLPLPGSALAWVALSAMGEVVEVDLATRTVVRRLQVGREPDGLGFSPVRVER